MRDKAEKPGPLQSAIQQQAGLVAKQREQRTWKRYVVRDSDCASPGQRELRKARSAQASAASFEKRLARADSGTVRKDGGGRDLARGLIEKASDDLPGEEVAPDDVLKRSHGLLLTAFRKDYGRDPQPGDDEFWSAYRAVIHELRAAVAEARS